MGEVRNVKTTLNKDTLIIEVDVSDKALKEAPLSKTGKSHLVASTGGFIPVNGKFKLGLNVLG